MALVPSRRRNWLVPAVLVCSLVSLASGQRAAPKPAAVLFAGSRWMPVEQVSHPSFIAWTYRHEKHANVRMVEYREIKGARLNEELAGGWPAFCKGELIEQAMQCRSPNTGRWVDHGLTMTFFTGGKIAYSVNYLGEPTAEGAAIPPFDEEWEGR